MRRLDEICVDRRAIIAALPGLILLPGVVAACSSSTPTATESKTDSTSASSAAGSSAAPGASAGGVQVPVAEVPVGTAIVVAGPPPYVVAQPEPNKFVAFSAVCTHRGTTVKVGTGTELVCPAHGSQFEATTGAVLKGPAASPLKSVPVAAEGGTLTIG